MNKILSKEVTSYFSSRSRAQYFFVGSLIPDTQENWDARDERDAFGGSKDGS